VNNVRCKLQVSKVTQFEQPAGTGEVHLRAVFESKAGVQGNACTENHVFGEYTPTAEVRMTILNPAAFATFREALDQQIPFYVDFTPATQ
jgi:hypothetical protein